jgi:hypothetical protein
VAPKERELALQAAKKPKLRGVIPDIGHRYDPVINPLP